MALSPVATCRLQLTPQFDFRAASRIIGDLARLGVSHVYLSPVAEAVVGSTHGYDVVDPSRVREELGGREALWHLAEEVSRHGLGLVIDIVPNHVSVAEADRNPWWWALLTEGRDGETAPYFDIDWDHGDGRVIVPVLGAALDEEVATGAVDLADDAVRYHEHRYPRRADRPTAPAPDVAAELDHQHYRLLHWRDPDRNARRFFTIDDLLAIRPEIPAVSAAVHRTVRDLEEDDLLDGVRVDHVDGLADPAGYLADLRETMGPAAWILVEKILVGDEVLAPSWPVDGTTGYEWITMVDHLFTPPVGEQPFTEHWRRVAAHRGQHELDYHDHEAAGVRAVLRTSLRPDLERVARAVAAAGAEEPRRSGTAAEYVEPLIELTVALGRYRTYLTGRATPPSEFALVERAAGRAARALFPTDRAWLDRLVETIRRGEEAARRWQQLTGPALAKGGEDRALYRYLRLVAHNEVGGDPGRWSLPLDAFHRHNARVAATHPTGLLAATTHDTKRSEDVRARLLALAERPSAWLDLHDRATALLASESGRSQFDPVSVHLALQTAVGAWPISRERLALHLVKAAREADVCTSWTAPVERHEAMLHELADIVVDGALREPVEALAEAVAAPGRAVALAQLALRLTAPGVPDLYQGADTWLHTLVDPDNRGPLDVTAFRERLATVAPDRPVWSSPEPKTALIARILATRRARPACFAAGARYRPVEAEGGHAPHVVAFHRAPGGGDGAGVTTVASRFPGSRPDGWGDTDVPIDAPVRDVLAAREFDRGRVPLSALLGDRPAAVLVPLAE